MSLRLRIAVGIVLLAAFVTVGIWAVSSRAILRPFAHQVFDAFLDQAVYVAERVEAGEDPEVLGERLGMQVRMIDDLRELPRHGRGFGRHRRGHPPRRSDGIVPERGGEAFGQPAGRGFPPGFRLIEREGRRIAFPPGPRNRLIIETEQGWVGMRRDLDLERPQRQLRWVLLALGIVVLLVAGGLATAAVRPLTRAREGMERIAAGDMAHRLDERGPDELQRVARAFNRMADRIDTLLRTERELMAGMSHELRTPLARLRLETELLRDAGAPAKRVDAMEGDLEELDGLIGQLLHLSRLQLGHQRLAEEPVDLLTLAESAREAADLAGHDVAITGEGGTVHADPVLLERVVLNLLQNAGRYAPEGTRVVVRVDAPRIVVEDEGPGVPEASLPRLFDPFWRAEGSRARETGGLGLGLMFVRQIVELHGGTVVAANRPEGGLRVTVDLA